MSRGGMKAPSQRQLRVGEEVRHVLANVLERGEIRDPDVAGKVVTVTEVSVSPDLRNASVYVVEMGGGDVKALLEQRQKRIPIGFMGDGRDTANAALFLASDEARFVTGTEIVVDGGMTVRCD